MSLRLQAGTTSKTLWPAMAQRPTNNDRSACEKVLGTAELFEMIILEVPSKRVHLPYYVKCRCSKRSREQHRCAALYCTFQAESSPCHLCFGGKHPYFKCRAAALPERSPYCRFKEEGSSHHLSPGEQHPYFRCRAATFEELFRLLCVCRAWRETAMQLKSIRRQLCLEQEQGLHADVIVGWPRFFEHAEACRFLTKQSPYWKVDTEAAATTHSITPERTKYYFREARHPNFDNFRFRSLGPTHGVKIATPHFLLAGTSQPHVASHEVRSHVEMRIPGSKLMRLLDRQEGPPELLKSMLILQPACRELRLRFTVDKGTGRYASFDSDTLLQNAEGLWLGDVIDALRRLVQKWKLETQVQDRGETDVPSGYVNRTQAVVLIHGFVSSDTGGVKKAMRRGLVIPEDYEDLGKQSCSVV